jgi:hypothetical protein
MLSHPASGGLRLSIFIAQYSGGRIVEKLAAIFFFGTAQ